MLIWSPVAVKKPPPSSLQRLYPCEVTVAGPDGQSANAKSVMGVLLLCGSQGTVIEVRARGARADEVVVAIGELIKDRFGESE